MTQIVNPSIDRAADSFLTAGSLAYAGLRDGGIVPSGEVTELAKQSAIDETALDGFSFSTSGSSLDVTISPGEAFVFGSWLAKDTTTTVTLPPSSTVSGIILTWDKDSPNTVQIGLSSDFDEFPDPDEYLIVAGGFLTDENGVTQSNDPRKFVSIDAERLEGNETSEIKPNISDSGSTVVENAGDINVEGGLSASNDGDGSATIVDEAQYTDTDAINAVDSESSLSVNISGDANTVDGFNFVENGNSASNVINYDSTNKDIDIDGQNIANLSIDGQEVQEVTINGSVTWARAIDATGGTTVIDRTINGVDYRIHAFESVGSSTFSVTEAPSGATVDVLVVGGGGGGGNTDNFTDNVGGGGGAGGLIQQSYSINSSESIAVDVGSGGGGSTNGANSSFGNITALGGGAGGRQNNDGSDGGSGGGAGSGFDSGVFGLGTSGQGNDGGDGFANQGGSNTGAGGGGGKSQKGGSASSYDGGDGGDGLDLSSVFGTSFGDQGYFSGGGGGAASNPGSGGLGGGANGGTGGNPPNGQGNSGGGGGGSRQGGTGGSGGSGIVLIRYKI